MASTETSGSPAPPPEADEIFLAHVESLGPGEEPRLEELCAEHPEMTRELREAAADWAWLESRRRLEPRVTPEALEPDAIDRLAAQDPGERYTIQDEIGRGGMGTVYRAWDARLRRTLAMKVSEARREPSSDGRRPSRSRSLYRFLEEAQVMAQLDHPGVPAVHDVGVDEDGRVWFTLHMVRGLDLKSVLDRVRDGDASWSVTRVLGVLVRVCETLAFAHKKGVVHRDVKPGNVMVGRFGETYVMDWGLARVREREDVHRESLRSLTDPAADDALVSVRREEARRTSLEDLLTLDGSAIGTPSYMAPEQARGDLAEIGPAADVYAAGAVLYELLSGRPPYADLSGTHDAIEVLRAVRVAAPTPLARSAPGADPELVSICEKAMEREPERRYADMEALADDLRAYLENRVVTAHRTGPVVEIGKWVRRNRLAATALGAVLAVLIAGLAATAYVQTARKNELADANDVIVAEKERADLQAYAAHIAAAQGALALHRIDLAREQLGRCDPALRGWEWSYLAGRLDAAVMTLVDPVAPTGPRREVWDVAWSPDGAVLASAHYDGLVRVWSAGSGELLRRLEGHGAYVTALAFAPDGATLVSADDAGTVLAWDVEADFAPTVLYANAGRTRDVAFSPDGARIAVAHGDLRVTRLDGGADPLRVPLGGVVSVDFSADGERLVTCDQSNTIRVLDAATGDELAATRAQDGALYAHHRFPAVFHPDGERLAVMPQDGDVRLLDADLGVTRVLTGFGVRGWSLAFSPDGARLAATSTSHVATIWDVATGAREYVAAGHTDVVKAVAWEPGGARFATASDDGSVKVWDPRRRTEPERLSYFPDRVENVAFHPNGKVAAAANPRPGLTLWDLETGTILARLAEDFVDVWTVAYSPDGARLAGGGNDGGVRIFDGASGAREALVAAHAGAVLDVDFAPAGGLLASTARDGVVLVDAAAGLVRARIDGADLGDAGAPQRSAFAPDGTRLAILCEREIVVWDLTTAAVVRRAAHDHPSIRDVAYAPNGEALVTCGGTDAVRVWNATTLDFERELVGHVAAVRAVAFTPDGTRLATASRDQTVKLWDFASGRVVATLLGFSDWGADVAFSADGERLLICSNELHLFEPRPSGRDLDRLRAVAEELRAEVREVYYRHLDVDAAARELSARDDLAPLERRAALHLARATLDGHGPQILRARQRIDAADSSDDELLLALRCAERAAALAPNDPEAHELAGRALLRLGRGDEAAEHTARADALRAAAEGEAR